MTTAEEKLQIRNVVYQADAFRMSFAMARIVYARLLQTLRSIEPRFQATGTFDDAIASALSDAWGLVDILHRTRDLAEQTRLASARDPKVQVFIRATEPVKTLRNHVQHFRTEIGRLPASCEPLFGTLSWISSENSQRCYSIMSGTAADGVTSSSATYDRQEREFVETLRLAAGESHLDLDLGFTALKGFERRLHEILEARGAKSLVEEPLGVVLSVEVGQFPLEHPPAL